MYEQEKTSATVAETKSHVATVTLEEMAERQNAISRLRKRAEQVSVSNFDLRDMNDSFAMMMMKSAKSVSLWEVGKITIDVQYMHAQEGEATDEETGEVINKTRCTFIDNAGSVFHTGSAIVADVVLTMLEQTLGRKRFDPPLTCTFEKIKAGPKKSYLIMSVDLDSLRLLQEITANGDGKIETSKNT